MFPQNATPHSGFKRQARLHHVSQLRWVHFAEVPPFRMASLLLLVAGSALGHSVNSAYNYAGLYNTHNNAVLTASAYATVDLCGLAECIRLAAAPEVIIPQLHFTF